MKEDRQKIFAIHDNDLDDILTQLNLKKEFYEGELRCVFCNRNIDRQNFHALFYDNEVKFVCDNQDCKNEYLK